jgi:hypothetical protein
MHGTPGPARLHRPSSDTAACLRAYITPTYVLSRIVNTHKVPIAYQTSVGSFRLERIDTLACKGGDQRAVTVFTVPAFVFGFPRGLRRFAMPSIRP